MQTLTYNNTPCYRKFTIPFSMLKHNSSAAPFAKSRLRRFPPLRILSQDHFFLFLCDQCIQNHAAKEHGRVTGRKICAKEKTDAHENPVCRNHHTALSGPAHAGCCHQSFPTRWHKLPPFQCFCRQQNHRFWKYQVLHVTYRILG